LQLALRQFLTFLRDADLFRSGVKIQERFSDVLFDAVPQVGNLVIDALETARDFLVVALAITIEQGEVDLPLDEPSALYAADAATQPAIVTVDAQLGR